MSGTTIEVRVGAGSLAAGVDVGFTVPHAWTTGGIAVEGTGTGGHLFLTSVATCVVNDVWREAEQLGVDIHGVEVRAAGEFDGSWASATVEYAVRVDSDAGPAAIEALLARVDDVAEIPRVVRGEVRVSRR